MLGHDGMVLAGRESGVIVLLACSAVVLVAGEEVRAGIACILRHLGCLFSPAPAALPRNPMALAAALHAPSLKAPSGNSAHTCATGTLT